LGVHTKETISVKGAAETVSARRREKKAGLKEGQNQTEG
jgi:hypothetical protein